MKSTVVVHPGANITNDRYRAHRPVLETDWIGQSDHIYDTSRTVDGSRPSQGLDRPPRRACVGTACCVVRHGLEPEVGKRSIFDGDRVTWMTTAILHDHRPEGVAVDDLVDGHPADHRPDVEDMGGEVRPRDVGEAPTPDKSLALVVVLDRRPTEIQRQRPRKQKHQRVPEMHRL